MPVALPQPILDRLAASPFLLVVYILLLLLFAAIANADKLRAAFRRPQQWETERARIAANRRYWELQAFKKAQGFESQPDPYPQPARPAPEVATERRSLTYWERLGYASLGAYLGTSSPFPVPIGSDDFESLNYLGVVLAVLATVLTTGLLVARLGQRIRARALLILTGAIAVPVTAVVVGLLIALVLAITGQFPQAEP